MGSYKKLIKLLIMILMDKCPNFTSTYCVSASMRIQQGEGLSRSLLWGL